MPGFRPAEEQGLGNLLAALQGGLDPNTGYSILQTILGQQQARVQQKQEQARSLIDLLQQQAQTGQTLAGSTALADAMTPRPGIGPQIDQALQALYPEGPNTYAPAQYPGATPSELRGAGLEASAASPQPLPPGQQLSPMYQVQNQPTTPQDLLAIQQLEQEQQAAQASVAQLPIITAAFAKQAVGLLQNGVVDPNTGEAMPVTPDRIVMDLMTHPAYTALDPTTQAAVLVAVQNALSKAGQMTSQATSGSVARPGFRPPGLENSYLETGRSPAAIQFETSMGNISPNKDLADRILELAMADMNTEQIRAQLIRDGRWTAAEIAAALRG